MIVESRGECPICCSHLASRWSIPSSQELSWRPSFVTNRARPKLQHWGYRDCSNCGARVQSQYVDEIETMEGEPADRRRSEMAARTHQSLFRDVLATATSILDYGAGEGVLLRDDPRVDRYDPVYGESSTLKKSYDVIMLMHVAEHLSKPRENLKWIHSRLGRDGMLLMTLHNHRHWLHQFFGAKSPIHDFQHSQLLSPRSVEHWVRDLFEVQVLRSYLDCYPADYILESGGFPTFGSQWTSRISLKLPLGNSMVIARKV